MELAAQLTDIVGQYLFWVLPFLFVLTMVVFFHELGHFLVARWCGVGVKAFSIGFGHEIFGFEDSKGTRWRFAWIPLGGYVKFVDDENAASVPDRGNHDRPRSAHSNTFHDKPLAQRAAVVAAGPIANFVLAIVIFAAIFTLVGERQTEPVVDVAKDSAAASAGFQSGDREQSINGEAIESFEELQQTIGTSANERLTIGVQRQGGAERELEVVPSNDTIPDLMGLRRYIPPRVDQIEPGSPADQAGFRPGDRVQSINGEAIETFAEMQGIVGDSAGEEVSITVQRNGEEVTLSAVPESRTLTDATGQTVERGLLGIRRNPADDEEGIWQQYDPATALWRGAERTWFVIATTMSYLYDVVTGQQAADQLGGPIRIAQVSGEVAQAGFLPLINLAAVLSVSIGLLNLFPIPMLDGGHLLYYAIEAARGRPLSEKAQEIGFRIGLALVLMLMIWATRNDLQHIWSL